MTIIDSHAHLWLKQDTLLDGQEIRTIDRGRSIFLGEVRQMLPPFMIDGKNSVEAFLANMDYAQVQAAVITQEFIDGLQNDYLREVARQHGSRIKVCGMCNFREHGFLDEAKALIQEGFSGIAIPGHRLPAGPAGRMCLNCDEMMEMFKMMEQRGTFLSLCLSGTDPRQAEEMEEVVAECPELKVAIGHFGMPTEPCWRNQLRLARHKNVMVESGGITWLYNSEFYPFPTAVKAIREAADMVGIEHLMWGSDYPRTITAITYKMSYYFILKSNLLTQREKELFLGLNAKKFYGFGALPELPYIKNMSE